jgi:uncharacterized membrane protein YeaQ/YmgE (transglycosylase-associated protein family)
MKPLLIVIGVAAAFYGILGLASLVSFLTRSDLDATTQGGLASGMLFPTCIGAAVALACFRRVFRKPPA